MIWISKNNQNPIGRSKNGAGKSSVKTCTKPKSRSWVFSFPSKKLESFKLLFCLQGVLWFCLRGKTRELHSLTYSEPTDRPKSQERSRVLFGLKKHLKGKKHAWPAATGSVKKKSKGEREREEWEKEYIKCKSNSLTR